MWKLRLWDLPGSGSWGSRLLVRPVEAEGQHVQRQMKTERQWAAKRSLLCFTQACIGIPVLSQCGLEKAALCLPFLICELDKILPDTVGKLK